MDKGAKDKLAGSPGENGGKYYAQKDLHSRTGRDETKRKTQEGIIIIIIIFINCNWVITRWQCLLYISANMKMVRTNM